MQSNRGLFWHRRDLRINDNLGLSFALSQSRSITAVFIIDPIYIGENTQTIASSRLWFLGESLIELYKNWEKLGSRLLIIKGDPISIIPKLAKSIDAKFVTWNKDVEPYSISRDSQINNKLIASGIKTFNFWDQLLVSPEEIFSLSGTPYKVFTPFWKSWIKKVEVKFKGELTDISPGFSENSCGKLIEIDDNQLRNLYEQSLLEEPKYSLEGITRLMKDYPFIGSHLCPCKPGENESKKQLKYFHESFNLYNYAESKNIPGTKGTSTLSAALNIGTISPRQAWKASQLAWDISSRDQEKVGILDWRKELAWREFYQHIIFHFPNLTNGPYKKKWQIFPWENNEEWFTAWQSGLTGVPIVDAAMRQLRATGWMHNRCRMIVASFLVKDLICDWRWGEKFFMQELVDGDLSANNGGWQWSSSSGMDTKPLRIFNPYLQTARYDKNANYIREWLPELKSVSTADLISGAIPPLERKGYPPPIVNHNTQQLKFKFIYATLGKITNQT